MKILSFFFSLLLLAACSAEPGSEAWCAAKEEQAKSEWSSTDAATYARHCLFDDMAVGSQHWCDGLSSKDKGEWTANETASFAKHCVI